MDTSPSKGVVVPPFSEEPFVASRTPKSSVVFCFVFVLCVSLVRIGVADHTRPCSRACLLPVPPSLRGSESRPRRRNAEQPEHSGPQPQRLPRPADLLLGPDGQDGPVVPLAGAVRVACPGSRFATALSVWSRSITRGCRPRRPCWHLTPWKTSTRRTPLRLPGERRWLRAGLDLELTSGGRRQ